MTLAISIAAILISLASFAFGLYQYRSNQKVSLLSKINEILKQGYILRKSVQDLRDKIDVTDDIDSYENELDMFNSFIENIFSAALNPEKVTMEEVYKVERSLIELELSFSLLVKQINIAIEFNNELKAAGHPPLTTKTL